MTDRPMTADPDDLPLATGGASEHPTVVFWGTYDIGKPRTRILRDGLREIGVEVVEIHADIWAGHEDKSQVARTAMLGVALHGLLAYPGLIWRYLRCPAHDAVIVPYLGQIDVLVLRPFAWLRRRPVAWDMFLSLYDTIVCDRRMTEPRSVVARLLKVLEWCACRAANRVLMDTPAHARRIVMLFALTPERVEAVPVGAEPGAFADVPARTPHDGPVRIVFYGQLIPLHGVETILEAALSERGRDYAWHLIGEGQHSGRVEAALADAAASHVTWERWRPYDDLRSAIAEADICLGIFGSSDKAASVVPNKVYQSLLAGRSVVTRRSPAMEEAFPEHPALALVDPGDANALLDGIERVVDAGFPILPSEHLGAASPAGIARSLMASLTPLIERRSRHAQ